LKQNKSVALVSEAGTPGVSDPGTYLINRVIENKLPLTVVPGPTALIAGLVLSGFDSNRFVFEGFLPVKHGARKSRLKELARQKNTLVLYESPHRMIKLLEEVLEVFGDREIACVRELTKKFEEVKRDKISALLAHFKTTKPRGEFVVVIPPCNK
jgi:16S rRNA (cytidine1402-2'-O)-methyltransferase